MGVRSVRCAPLMARPLQPNVRLRGTGEPKAVRERQGYRSMKPRQSVLRLKRFDLAEKVRKVANLEGMIREFDSMIDDLDRQVAAEESRTGVRDRSHFAYSTFAKSALQRRDNLVVSRSDLDARLQMAAKEHEAAAADVAAAEAADALDSPRGRHDRVLSALVR